VRHLAPLLLGFPLSFTGSVKLGLLSSIGHVLPCGRCAETPVTNVDQGRGVRLAAAFCRALDIHFQRCHDVPLHASFDKAALAAHESGRKLTLVGDLRAVARLFRGSWRPETQRAASSHALRPPIFFRWVMATQPQIPNDLKETKRQLREALQDCDDLLEHTKELLRRTQQDNDPQK